MISSCTACTIRTGGVGTVLPSLMLSKTCRTSGVCKLLQRPVHQIVHILECHGDDGPEGGHIFEPAEELLALGGRVFFDHPFQTRVYMGERGDDKAG